MIYLVKLVISFGIIGLCFQMIDLKGFKHAVSALNPYCYLLAVCVTTIASIVMPALVTFTAMGTGRLSFSFPALIMINFSIRLYTILLPRAVATGIRFMKYKKAHSGKDAFVVIVFEKVTQLTIMMTFASIFLFLELEKHTFGNGGNLIYLLTLFINGACILVFCTFFSQKLASLLRSVTDKISLIMPAFLKKRMASLWDAASAYQNLNRKSISSCLIYSSISYGLFILAPYIVAKSMGIDITLVALAWMRALIMLLALIPVTVAGLGAREIGFIAFLELYNIPHATALAFSLLLFFQHIFIALVVLIYEVWIHLVRPLFLTEKPISINPKKKSL